METFHREERRWLLSARDAEALEAYLWHIAPAHRYGVESIYVRITKRARIRLRQYLVAGSQKEAATLGHKEAEAATAALGLDPHAEKVVLGEIRAHGLRRAGMEGHLRSAGPFQRLDAGSLRRGTATAGGRRRGQGESAEADTPSVGTTES